MKSKILNNLLFIGALLINALVYGQSAFNNYYVSGRLSGVENIIAEPNGDFILTGYFKDSATLKQGFECRRINSNGNTLLRKRFLIGNEDIGVFLKNKHVLNFNSTKYFYTGGTYTGTVSTVLFAAIDKNSMDTLWVKRFTNGDINYSMAHIFKIKPNEIWLVGTCAGGTLNLSPTIIKYDTLGNLLGTKTFSTYTYYECYNIAYDASNAKFYTAGLNFNTNPLTSYNLACIDTSGNVIWNNQISPNADLTYFNIELYGSEILLCGRYKYSSILVNSEYKLTFSKYQKSNGTHILTKHYGKEFMATGLYAMHIKNNSIFLVGTYSKQISLFNGQRHDGVFLKIKHNGDSLLMRLYDNFTGNVNNGETFFDIKECNDGGFIMGGAPIAVSAPQSQNWVVKTDSNGVGPGMVTVGIKEFTSTNFKLTIYPVPAKDILNIELLTNNNAIGSDEARESKNTIEIINIFGQVIKTAQLSAANNTIDVNGLKAGVYFLYATINNEVFKQKIIIEK